MTVYRKTTDTHRRQIDTENFVFSNLNEPYNKSTSITELKYILNMQTTVMRDLVCFVCDNII